MAILPITCGSTWRTATTALLVVCRSTTCGGGGGLVLLCFGRAAEIYI